MEISKNTVYENKPPVGDAEKPQVGTEKYQIEGENKYKQMRRQSTVFSIISMESSKDKLNIKPKKSSIPPRCKLWLLRAVTLVGIICVFAIYLPRIVLTLKLSKLGKSARNLTGLTSTGNSSSFRSQRILSAVNLSNLSIECPTMYIFVPENNVCEPQCGKWSGCGIFSFYIEKYLLASLTLGAILLGFFTIISWILVVRNWKIKHFPIFFCAIQALLISTLIGIIDIPGYGYFYCQGQEVSWSQIRQTYQHATIYASILNFAGVSLIVWLACVFINISLTVYFPLNKTIASKKFQITQIVVEIVFAWVLPILFPIGTSLAGINGGLETLIQQPQSHSFRRPIIIHLILMFICIAMLISAILIIYKLRSQNIMLSKFSTKPIRLSTIEKRYLVYACVYLVIASLRTALLIATDFQQKKLEFDLKEYTACITLQSKIINPQNTQTEYVSTLFNLSTALPQCTPPCVFALDAIAIRVGLFVTFLVTSIQSLPNIIKRVLSKMSCRKGKAEMAIGGNV